MEISIEIMENIPYIKIYHIHLSEWEASKLLRVLKANFPEDGEEDGEEEEFRWKSGIILDQISDITKGDNNGRRNY